MKVTETLNILISLYHVSRDTCTVHGRGMKTRYSGAHCILKVERLKTGEMVYERRYLSLRPPPEISLKHDHNWTKGNDQLGSAVEQQPVGKLVQQSFGEAPRAESSKPTQSKPNPICDRTEKPVETERVLWRKEKRPIHKRLLVNVCKKNLVLLIERGNL